MDALVEMFRFKTWATLRLIEYCEGLADEHLDATTPGTYGTIRETLRHMVDAEEGYFSILTRDRFPSKAAAEAFVRNDRLPDGPGLEPGWVTPHAPQTCASTSSASRPTAAHDSTGRPFPPPWPAAS